MHEVAGVSAATVPATRAEAVRRQRLLFHEVASAWAGAFPQSADALEAVAMSLEMLGDPTSLDTVRRARSFASTPDERLRIGTSEVWMRVRFSLPADMEGLRAARSIADSLLTVDSATVGASHGALASLAALTGRANLAAALSRHPSVTSQSNVPPPLAGIAPSLLVFAALGGPVDSIRTLERLFTARADQASLPTAARLEWLVRPVTLAFPSTGYATVRELEGQGDYLIDAQAAFTRGDAASARRILDDIARRRASVGVADLTFDTVYPEASLLVALGETQRAIAMLDAPLGSLRGVAPQLLSSPVQAGALVRAMALRAEMAERAGDAQTAGRWGRAVVTLLSDSDDFLKPLVGRMELLSRSP
jgi:hypothetical protein